MIIIDDLFDTTPFTRPSTPRCFRRTLAVQLGARELSRREMAEIIGAKRRRA